MKLSYGTTSPYVRKVTVMAHECGLHDRIERIDTLPWDPETGIGTVNPVGKVPALLTDDGHAIYDSAVILDYLDRQHGGDLMIPASDPVRTDVLTRAALADGAMEAVILLFAELTRRPEELQWDFWVDRQTTKVARSLDAMNAHPAIKNTQLSDAGAIGFACCVGWIDFRGDILNIDWRTGRPALASWFDEISKRPSMQQTVPVNPS